MNRPASENTDKPEEQSPADFLCKPVAATYGSYDPGATDPGMRAAPISGHVEPGTGAHLTGNSTPGK